LRKRGEEHAHKITNGVRRRKRRGGLALADRVGQSALDHAPFAPEAELVTCFAL